ncbi:MAG TPA: M15 family metallopeptidase [Actinomycetota bacterium]|nr:M15 family metallopeptidase [Actinomycetota bacterium]
MRARWLVALVVACVLTSCGGRVEPTPTRTQTLQPRSITLPDPISSDPSFRITSARPIGDLVKRIEKQPGVIAAAAIRKKTLAVRTGGRRVKLRVGAVAPLHFRSVSPEPTRAAEFVWTSLLQGETVITPGAAARLGIESSATLDIGTGSYSVGAFADNGVPNTLDVMVANHVADRLGLPQAHELVVGTGRKAKLARVRAALKRLAPRANVKAIHASDPPAVPEILGQAEGSLIGTMTFRVKKNGFIEPDPAWVTANIVNAEVPILGQVTCHRLLVGQLGAALGEIEQEGLADLIDPSDYGGCYVPRFIGRDSRRSLSMHAFGLAVDLNVSRNYYATKGDMDIRVVSIFDKWGFGWGGTWSTPDPMHFELARLLET